MILHGGLLAMPGNTDYIRADLEFDNGKITQIRDRISGSEMIDVSGFLIFPGAIDPHVHFNDPGFSDREDFCTGTSAAAAGGVTTVIDMPCTSLPPVTDKAALSNKLKVTKNKAIVDYCLYGGVSGQSFANLEINMKELRDFVPGFKTYFTSGMDTFSSLNLSQFEQVVKLASKLSRPVLLHAEDPNFVSKINKSKAIATPYDHYLSRPEAAEIEAVKKASRVASKYQAHIHIVHISTAEAAEIVAENKFLSGETAPHYLQFDLADYMKLGSVLKVNPPLKKPENRMQLWHKLIDGGIDFVATDHAPAPKQKKNTGSILTDYAGIPGIETMLLYLYWEGLVKNKLSLTRFLQITCENAARTYGLFDRKGSLEVGKDADMVIFDPNAGTFIKAENFYSKGKSTPFEGQSSQGKIRQTYVRGNLVYDCESGIVAKPGIGEYLKP
jgi:allantoinase